MDTKYSELPLRLRVLNIKDFALIDFNKEQLILFVISTSGDGKMIIC